MAFAGGGSGTAVDFAAGGAGGFGFGLGVVLTGAFVSGIGSAVLSGGGGVGSSLLYKPGDSFAGAVSVTTGGVGRATPERLPTTLTLIPPEPPAGDPHCGPKDGKMFGETNTIVNSAPCNTMEPIIPRSIRSPSDVISSSVPTVA